LAIYDREMVGAFELPLTVLAKVGVTMVPDGDLGQDTVRSLFRVALTPMGSWVFPGRVKKEVSSGLGVVMLLEKPSWEKSHLFSFKHPFLCKKGQGTKCF
jgi:hypothetical protein